MNKGIRLIKRLIALFLVLVFCIESFGAVVSDNDGSAFITKAEFDSLKNNFQSQIDQYNTSIDSKIDGAIASYLAGIKTSKTTVFDPAIENYNEIRWVSGWYEKTQRRSWNVSGSSISYTDESGASYRKPLFRNQRVMRLGRQMVTVPWGNNGIVNGAMLTFMDPNDDTSNNNFPYHSATVDGSGGNWGIGDKLVELNKNDNNEYVYNLSGNVRFMEEECITDVLNASLIVTSDGNSQSTYQLWQMRGSQHGFFNGFNGDSSKTWLHFNTPASGNFLDFDFRFGARNSSGWSDRFFYGRVALNSANTNFGGPLQYTEPDNERYRSRYNTIVTLVGNGDSWQRLRDPYRDRYLDMTQANKDEELFNYMLLGADDNNEINVGYRINSSESQIGNALRFDFSTAPMKYWKPTGLLTYWSFSQTNLITSSWSAFSSYEYYSFGGAGSRARSSEVVWIKNLPSSLNLPYWNRIKVNELKNDNFKYNKNTTSLKLGQGMPLLQDISASGNVEIRFKYKVTDNDQASSATPSNKVKLYIKNKDFTTNNDIDYYTTDDGKSLKAYELNVDSSTVNVIKFGVAKGDNVWLRLCPENINPSGFYAQISDLQISLIEE